MRRLQWNLFWDCACLVWLCYVAKALLYYALCHKLPGCEVDACLQESCAQVALPPLLSAQQFCDQRQAAAAAAAA